MLKYWQRIVTNWGIRAFGEAHMNDRRVRALRLLEEAAEYAQACDVMLNDANHVLIHVYHRPKGHPFQELGGVFVTALAAASSQLWQAEVVIEEEVLRVLAKPPEHFAKRNQEKIDAGLR